MIIDDVKEILADQLNVDIDKIDITSSLADDLGADSLDAIDIVMTIEDQYSIEVPDEVIENMETVEDIVSFIEAHTTEE
ncbi:MAG: acyl carrier protein [Eubacterium sp.]